MIKSIPKGTVFGTCLYIKDVLSRSKDGRRYSLFKCECGKNFVSSTANVIRQSTKGCGCKKGKNLVGHDGSVRVTHGYTREGHSSIYSSWNMMKQRCVNPNNRVYKNYGGRGIKVCERWLRFENFIQDMGDRPSLESSLERVDNDGNYCKENCKWATRYEQQRNKRSNRFVTINGVTKILQDWLKEKKMPRTNFYRSLKKGKTAQEVLYN